jgi:hypothetical protein
VWDVEEEGSMSIEGMLCAAGLTLLAAGVLVRIRTASTPGQESLAIGTETAPPQHQVAGSLGARSPGWRVGTAALWLGVALLLAAGGVVLLAFMRYAAAS